MRTLAILRKTADSIEQAESLDKPAVALAGLIGKVVRPGPVEDTLSGVSSGHPLHPALVALPIGAWTSALLLDLTGGDETAARQLIGAGLVFAVPTAASGASDWVSTHGAEQRIGFVHAVTNYAAIACFGASWFARRRGARSLGVALSAAGAVTVAAAGWLGGHLAYAQGVGIDVTAFQQFPSDWTDAGAADDLPADGKVSSVDVDGIPVLLSRRHDAIVAMADRCTHRGAPLHEGEVVDGCIVCPWHGSAFSLRDGSVESGPATHPQPLLENRVVDGRVQVRRTDARALRTNQTGI